MPIGPGLASRDRARRAEKRAREAENEDDLAEASEFAAFLAREMEAAGQTPEDLGERSGVGEDIVTGFLEGTQGLDELLILRLAFHQVASGAQSELCGHMLQSEGNLPIPANPCIADSVKGLISGEHLRQLQRRYQRFRELLREVHGLGISQKKVAFISGVDRSTLSRITNHGISAPERAILRIAAALLLGPSQTDRFNGYLEAAGYEPMPEDDHGRYY